MYQALYRKYRPKSFDEVTGQKNIISTLSNAIINNKLSHAYLFSGPRGTGKTSIAKIIAKTINCENRDGIKICNSCVCCTQNISDIIEIDAASNNGVDEIRELKNKINLVPTYGKYKVYIIDEVHMLTMSAFNALLKTLEEPPQHIIFILATTEPQKIPATILSRCQRFDFRRIDDDSIIARLKEITKSEKIDIDDSALIEIARISDGGMRDAINLLDQSWSYSDDKITIDDIHEINGTISQFDIEKLLDKYIDNDLTFILKQLEIYNCKGKNLIKLAQEIVFYLRNVLIYLKAPNYLLENNIGIEAYKSISEKISEQAILNLIHELNNVVNEMKISNNPKLNLELIFIKNANLNVNDNQATIVSQPKNISQNISQKEIVEQKEKIINKNISQENLSNDKNSDNEDKPITKEKNEYRKISKEIRINNTLAKFDKKLLQDIKLNILRIKPLLLNQKYSQFVSIILDGVIKAASDEYLIFMYKLESDCSLFNENISMIEEIITEGTGKNFKVISVNSNEWEKIKNEFNTKTKRYEYKKEEILEEEKKETINELFDGIIEYK